MNEVLMLIKGFQVFIFVPSSRDIVLLRISRALDSVTCFRPMPKTTNVSHINRAQVK